MTAKRKWLLRDVKEYEVRAPEGMDPEQVAESWNFGDGTVDDRAIGEHVEVFPYDDDEDGK